MIRVRIPALLAALPVTLFAHHLSHPVMASRDDAFRTPRTYLASADTVRVLVVMAQFQPDVDPRTTGNGQFVLSASGTPVVDAPPHNKRYVEDHLTFVQNYFRKASKGKVTVLATVLDSVVTLSGTMGSYTGAAGGATTAAASIARDAWLSVDAAERVASFAAYDCFVIVHAGVGHDIDLVSALGYDPGPLDVSSLYLGLHALQQAFGPTYQGIPVNNGTYFITNSIVVPETESRTIPAVGGDVLLPFSINGLLCASVGNFLGLPDLFDTQNGRSGIGRFGLEDGQAIFSFSGLFPPEPSAWEKYWLGWVAPIIAPAGTATLTLPAVALADTIYRVPISGQEYFLVENRNRDPGRDGETVTTSLNGSVRQQTFLHDTLGFASGDVSAITGVVTDVQDLDWSLPGGVGDDGTFYDGGILIWHIDEAVIEQTIGSDAINANPARRGVDVEEADGSQDIGQNYDFLAPGSGSEEGTALDFWFLGNASPVYKNEFSAATFPASTSNSGANSHVTISGFSVRGPRMSIVVRRGDQSVAPLPGFPKQIGEIFASPSLTAATLGFVPTIFVATNGQPVAFRGSEGAIIPSTAPIGKVYAWRSDTFGPAAVFSANGLLATTGVPGAGFVSAPAVHDTGAGFLFMLGQQSSPSGSPPDALHGFARADANGDSLADTRFLTTVAGGVTTPVVVNGPLAAVGGRKGRASFFSQDGALLSTVQILPDSTASIAGVSALLSNGTFVFTGSEGTVRVINILVNGQPGTPGSVRNFGRPITGPAAAGSFGRSGATGIAFATADGYLYLVDSTLNVFPGFPVYTGDAVSSSPAIADVDGDGSRDIVVFSGSKMCAYNDAGVSLTYFPYVVHSVLPFASAPIVGDVDGDGIPDVIGVTGDGLVVAFNRTGQTAKGFPLQAGRGTQCAAVFPRADSIFLAVASSDDGSVSAWLTGIAPGYPDPALYPWPQYQHDAQFSGMDFSRVSGTPLSSDFFPKNRAYNWPNPVYNGTTHIRYFVSHDATVSVRIYDLAGDLVTELSGRGVGGLDNEIPWDVSGVQSGVYFARIEASGGGQTGVAIIKVAVVK